MFCTVYLLRKKPFYWENINQRGIFWDVHVCMGVCGCVSREKERGRARKCHLEHKKATDRTKTYAKTHFYIISVSISVSD